MSTDAPLKERFRIPRWLNLLVVLLIAGFLIRTLVTGWEQIRDFDWQVDILSMVSAFIILLIYFCGHGLLWSWSVRQLGMRLAYRTGLEIYIASLLAKYIPGGVWSFANVALSARQAHLPSAITVFMFAVNMLLVVWAAGLCAVPILPVVLPGFPLSTLLVFATMLAISLLVGPSMFRWLLKLLGRWQNLNGDWQIASITAYSNVTFLLAAALLLQMLSCVSFYLYLSALTDIARGDVVLVASAWSAAWFMGFIVLFVPSGLGVREVSLTFLLGSMMSPSVATAISLGHRVLSTFFDLLLLFLLVVSYGLRKVEKHPQDFHEQTETYR